MTRNETRRPESTGASSLPPHSIGVSQIISDITIPESLEFVTILAFLNIGILASLNIGTTSPTLKGRLKSSYPD